MIKLIATDIDGTLLKDGSLLIDPEYMSVIDRLIDKGIIFVVCSGRQFSSEFKLFAPIKHKLLYITDGGTVVRTPKEILKTYPMDEDMWKGMCRMVRDELPACDYFAATPDFCFAEDGGSPVFHLLRDSYGFEMREVDDITRLDRNDIIKFTIFHPDKCEELCTPVSFRHGIKSSPGSRRQGMGRLQRKGCQQMDCSLISHRQIRPASGRGMLFR